MSPENVNSADRQTRRDHAVRRTSPAVSQEEWTFKKVFINGEWRLVRVMGMEKYLGKVGDAEVKDMGSTISKGSHAPYSPSSYGDKGTARKRLPTQKL